MRVEIALLPGDGIGPEVTESARAVLERVADRFGHTFHFTRRPIGGAAIDQCGTALPPQTLEACHAADAVLLGAVGGPKWDAYATRPEHGLLELRRHLGVFANLRPVAVPDGLAQFSPLRPEHVRGTDLLIVRELTGGIYFGKPRSHTPERALDTMVYSRAEIVRVAEVAFEQARLRRRRLASVDKANVLASSRLWRQVVVELAANYPDVEVEHLLVDAAAMALIRDPRRFDVLLTENLFGDILSDEAGGLAGSLGMLPSASLGAGRPGLFEPVHGSAPAIAGKGVANPVGAILSCAMLCRHLGLSYEAGVIETAVRETLESGVHTSDLKEATGVSTTRFTAEVAARVRCIEGGNFEDFGT